MGTVIQLKRSATPGKIPVVSDIVLGELAVNTYDGSAFLKKDNGLASIIQLATTDKLKTINNQNINGTGDLDGVLYGIGQYHKGQLYASNTPETYNYTTLWPAVYEE